MFADRTPVYLKGVSPRTETVDGETRKRVELDLMIQPFTSPMARDLGVLSNLFARLDGDPIEDVMKAELKIAAPVQRMTVSIARDENVGRVFENVQINPVLRVRKDKESPIYSATIVLDFPYPAPDDLLFLFSSYLEQLFVSFETMQGALDLAQDETPRRRKKETEQPALDGVETVGTIN